MADVESPTWWLERLIGKLSQDQLVIGKLERYYRGDHDLPFVPPDLDKRYLTQYHELLNQSKTNFMELVVDAVAERMKVQGIRLSGEYQPQADKEIWQYWQANNMDAEQVVLFTNALAKRRSYLSIWKAPTDDYPIMAVEDARQVIVENRPGTQKRAAALKLWVDEWTDQQRANIYLPDGIYKFQRKNSSFEPIRGWEEIDDSFVRNPIGVVPIVPFYNKRVACPTGFSEIEAVIPIQDRINGTVFNRVLAGWFTAFRQRWAAGLEIPTDPDTGKPIEPFKAAIDRLWISENPETTFGEFSQTDLKPYLLAQERDLQDMAVLTRTPRHYLFQSGQSPSGDAIQSAESGLVKKVQSKMEDFSDPLEEALRIARAFDGKPTNRRDSEIIWADPQTRSDQTYTSAMVAQYEKGIITKEIAQEQLGYSPAQIARMKEGEGIASNFPAILEPV